MKRIHHLNMKLKELRLKMNLKQKEIAGVIGSTVGAYSKYEVGDRKPSIEVLCRIADYYGVSVDYLIGRTADTMDSLSESEKTLVERYRSSDRFVQESTLEFMEIMDKRYREEKSHS